MKTLLLFLILTFSLAVSAQAPVAVNDTATAKLGGYVTVNVTNNDYSPEGLSFKVYLASGAHSFTDSTITYFFNYDDFYNVNEPYWSGYYGINDENGQADTESFAEVKIALNNHFYFDTLDINNIRTSIYAYNNHFWDGGESSLYEFPKGSGKNTIFNQSLWIGGKDVSQQLKIAAERYRQVGMDYWPGPISEEGGILSVDTSTAVEWQQVWKLTVEEVTYHKRNYSEPGYEPIKNILNWPAHGNPDLNQNEYLAPFIDVDGDSYYDPYQGDYPLIRGDQCIFFIFNDYREHTESKGEKLGLEIHGMAYEFESSEMGSIANTVFLSYKIFNRSAETLNDTYIGLFCDFDLGYARDDYVGCDVSRGAFYGYNGKEIDGSGEPESYGENPPAQGIVILGGPYMDSNGEDDPAGGCDESINGVGFGDGVVDNERYGMTKFVYFNNSANIQGDPQSVEDYYNYMSSIWKDGTAMEYGGNGHISSGAFGPSCNFMFPGLSDPCYWGTDGLEPFGPVDWTEENAGNNPEDRRGLSVMGPFTLLPHAMHKVDLAFVTAQGNDGPLSSVSLLKEYIDEVKNEYFEDSDYFGYQWLGIEEREIVKNSLHIYPNPTTSDVWIDLDKSAKEVQYNIHDIFGRLVKQGRLASSGKLNISLSGLDKGLYVVSLVADNKVYTSKVLKK